MNQSSLKHIVTRVTHPHLKLKRSVLLVIYSAYNAFCCYINGYSLAVTGDAFCYSGHGHALYQQQEPCSILFLMYTA